MRLILFTLFLTACAASPAPEFFGAKRVEVTREGRSYTVWHTEKRVEVVRHGYAKPGEHQAIRATMIDLIPALTGCKLNERTLEGDSGEMRGRVTCPAR